VLEALSAYGALQFQATYPAPTSNQIDELKAGRGLQYQPLFIENSALRVVD